MRSKLIRTSGILAVLAVGMAIGVAASGFMAQADAVPASTTGSAVVVSGAIGQAAYGGGVYTVVPVMDSGAGYEWMAYAMAFDPNGKVTVISTNPKKPEELGNIVKQFSIK